MAGHGRGRIDIADRADIGPARRARGDDVLTPAVAGGARGRDLYPAYCFGLLVIISVLTAVDTDLMHWFLIPVAACGLLIGRDAMDWFTGRRDPFDPRAVIGVLGVHLFFAAPLLMVLWDFQYDVARTPDDWRPWLGLMASLNAAGLVAYRAAGRWMLHRQPARIRRWRIDQDRALKVLAPALVISGLAQLYLFVNLGGLRGQVKGIRAEDLYSTSGLFKYQLIAGAFPLLLLITLTVLRSRKDRDRGRYSAAFFLLLLVFVIYFVTDGLRGSRSATIWTLFWAAGIIHYFWRRLDVRVILAGMVPLLLFMYLYGLYKSYGSDVFERYAEADSIAELGQHSGRTVKSLIIRDLSRSDIQAFMAYRLAVAGDRYSLEWGRTYAETLPRTFIPGWLWTGRPAVPRKAKANIQVHFGGPAPYGDRFSKVAGMGGEGMLNFHYPGVVLAFAVFGLAMGWYRRQFGAWPDYDARLFIAPFMANWFITALTGDFDNLLTFSLSKGAIPVFVLFLIVKRETLTPGGRPPGPAHGGAQAPAAPARPHR